MQWTKAKEFKNDYLKNVYGSSYSIARSAYKTANVPWPVSTLSLVAKITIGKASTRDPITVHVNLLGTSISSGGLVADKDDERGYFQDQIKVTMHLENHPQLIRVSDGPNTQNGTSHTTSSVSFSFGESGGAGFFGGTPTGNVGVNVGMSASNSFSRDLTDFKVVNKSDSHVVVHQYLMAASSKGPYSHPADLVVMPNFVESFEGIDLAEPPSLAVDDFPIISQAVWQAQDNRPINETIMLQVTIEQHLSFVSGYNHWLWIDKSWKGMNVSFQWNEKIPLQQLTSQQGTPILS